MCERF
jgi:hypothetical protein